MSGNINSYESPFCTRYASEEMQYIFSADKKFTTWRKLWVTLRISGCYAVCSR